MKKLNFLFLIFGLFNIAFAEEIYIVSNSNYCVLTPTENPGKNYLTSLNKVQTWKTYNGSSVINENIKLQPFVFNTDVCPNTIYLNEKDEGTFDSVDFLTNKSTSSHPYVIKEIQDKNIISSITKDLVSWMNKTNKSSFKPIKFIKVFDNFKYDSQTFQLIEAHSSKEFEDFAKKGDFSLVVLYNPVSKEIIPVETWFFKEKTASVKILNTIEGYLDIDNDSEYELMIRSSYYEGSSSLLYKIIHSKAVKKRSCVCGV